MGHILFRPRHLIDTLAENVGFKAGLLLNIKNLIDLTPKHYKPAIEINIKDGVKLHSVEYEELFYGVLENVGYAPRNVQELIDPFYYFREYPDHLHLVHPIMKLHYSYAQQWKTKYGDKPMENDEFIKDVLKQFGRVEGEIAIEYLKLLIENEKYSVWHVKGRRTDWDSREKLDKLFSKEKLRKMQGTFFDQRFIDYLERNNERIGDIHWRKFEELSAEYLIRNNYEVELGPGSNDDGVDVRAWDKETNDLIIVQCKRHKDKIDKVTVKGLAEDIRFEDASYGLIVTSNELSPGARETINARGYPIEEVNKDKLSSWLEGLRTPGTGIIYPYTN